MSLRLARKEMQHFFWLVFVVLQWACRVPIWQCAARAYKLCLPLPWIQYVVYNQHNRISNSEQRVISNQSLVPLYYLYYWQQRIRFCVYEQILNVKTMQSATSHVSERSTRQQLFKLLYLEPPVKSLWGWYKHVKASGRNTSVRSHERPFPVAVVMRQNNKKNATNWPLWNATFFFHNWEGSFLGLSFF